MRALQRFEDRLEQAISGVFARAFRSAVQPVEISAALQRELDNNAQILSRDRRLVPNAFHVELSGTDLDRLSPYDSTMADELGRSLQEHAQQQGYVFPGPLNIDFEPADDLTTGRFRVRSEAVAGVTHQATHTQVRRARVLLEVNGARHPLDAPGLVVGRGTDADLRINDPGISRRHIEFGVSTSSTTGGRSTTGGGSTTGEGPATGERSTTQGAPGVWVRDLGSTNGMLVDGAKVGQAALSDGSTVKIGTTTLTVRLVPEGGDDV